MKKLLSAAAMTGLCVASMAQANTAPALATITASKDAYVSRNGKIVPLTVKMRLMAGDRLITRARGSAKVSFNGKCQIGLKASSMLPISTTACTKPLIAKMDAGRAAYGNFSSAQVEGAAGGGAGAGGAGAGAGAAAGAGAGAGAAGAAAGAAAAGGLGVAGAVAGVAAAAGAAAAASSGGSSDNPTSP